MHKEMTKMLRKKNSLYFFIKNCSENLVLMNIGTVANLQNRPDITNLFAMKKTLQIQNGRTILTMFH